MDDVSFKSKKRKMQNTRECSICLGPFEKPKGLPCIHTFCLQCLEDYGKGSENKPARQPGDQMACPECRQTFTIPVGGFEKLPGNFFVEQEGDNVKEQEGENVKEQENAKDSPSDNSAGASNNCEVCSKHVAAMFCPECDQKLCDGCLVLHGKMRVAKFHKVIALDDSKDLEVLM